MLSFGHFTFNLIAFTWICWSWLKLLIKLLPLIVFSSFEWYLLSNKSKTEKKPFVKSSGLCENCICRIISLNYVLWVIRLKAIAFSLTLYIAVHKSHLMCFCITRLALLCVQTLKPTRQMRTIIEIPTSTTTAKSNTTRKWKQ